MPILGEYHAVNIKLPKSFIERMDRLQEQTYATRTSMMKQAVHRYLEAEEARLKREAEARTEVVA
jgi:predicted transcriptional regulator